MRYTARKTMRASEFLRFRNDLLTELQSVDSAIDAVLKKSRSQRAADLARALFERRQNIVDELAKFDVHVESHPAVWGG